MRHSFAASVAVAAMLAAAPAGAVTLVSQFSVANGTDLSGLTGAGSNRLGGFGSDLSYDAATGMFWGMSDRGPGGGVLPYAPRLQGFTLDIDNNSGAINGFNLQSTVLFKQANGQDFSGLNPQILNGSAATLGGSLDPEGLARLPNGNLLVSDEYGPSVYEFTPAGNFVRAFATPANLVPKDTGGTTNYVDGRSTITTGRQDNRGFEGLTVSPDGKTAYAVLQDPLVDEGRNTNNGTTNSEGRFSRNVRIVAYDVATGTEKAQYIYQLEAVADINGRIPGTANDFNINAQGRSIGVSAIQAVSDGTLLVLERDNRGLGVDDPTAATPVGSKRIYRIDLAGATDVSKISLSGTNTLPAGVNPVAKTATPFLDIAAALRAMGMTVPEKIEGFAFGPRLADGSYTLIVVTDNDFSVTQSGAANTQFDVCTSGVGGTSSQVALGAACPAGQSLIPNLIYSFKLSEAEYRTLTGAVPEPTTWAMMVLGFGLVGAAARRRSRVRVRFA
ncbi:esterase-like activity of phytase family protein [Sphingomonas sp. BT553]|uniref:Esterase-like activity of phytase family protein n=1 Tax=Sphingomonas mollis TaxID=2795726 RepID=A0ABS0XRE5_9SPHN|nr:esterase-like activity of phytase family protein [Sphingomonas sp. BT553]MBJ6122608.1 esterase-like activity of phytase family protein [Sphingomonas sp. BT553]